MNKQSKILLVDDNKNDYQNLSNFLQDNGYNVLKANGYNIDEAVSLLDPDLIIIENVLDNNAFYQKIKQKEIPILCIISAENDKALDLIVNNVNYIIKPFFYKDLTEHIDMLLKIRSLKDENSAYKMELFKLHKTANIASLSGIIAHNINNFLGAVIGYSDILMGVINGHEKAKQYIGKVTEASQNIAVLTQRLLENSRSLRSQPQNTNLRDLLNGVIFLYRDSKDIYIDMEIPDDLPEINIDKNQMYLAITNIFLHAQKMTSAGHKVIIRAGISQLPEVYAYKSICDKYVILSISYAGSCLDQEIVEQILKAFKIEKQLIIEPELLVARYIIEKHDGFISINNDPSEGTTFNVYLPTI